LIWDAWQPDFIVLHNTGEPNLANRPNGLIYQHILGLQSYYRDDQGWSGGPHLFIDDLQIWVFTPLTVPGVHSPSWNSLALGIEMLGDYDTEDFDLGRGAMVRDNAVAAIAILSAVLGIDPDTMRLHREDPRTTHHCPGDNVNKEEFIQLVKRFMGNSTPAEVEPPALPWPQAIIRPEEFGRLRERLPIFQAAAARYKWPDELEVFMDAELGPNWIVWVLAAIDSRESRFGLLLDEDGLGDGGHGHGELQIDDRSHGAFCASGRWRDLVASLEYVHKNVIAPPSITWATILVCSGKTTPPFSGVLLPPTTAAPGMFARPWKRGQDVDARTTGKDYSADVIERAMALKEALG